MNTSTILGIAIGLAAANLSTFAVVAEELEFTEAESRLAKETGLSPYIIDPPDVVLIKVAKLSPESADRVDPQQISGEHLVRPDGTIRLGDHGSVKVAGMTLAEAQAAVEKHLAGSFEDVKLTLDVLAYNSKVFYVVIEASDGETGRIIKCPFAGGQTVLDALSTSGASLRRLAGKRIWVARPHKDGKATNEVLSVDWPDLLKTDAPPTNHKLFPGDRVFVGPRSDNSEDAPRPTK